MAEDLKRKELFVFAERYRSHHDAERELSAALEPVPSRRSAGMSDHWPAVEKILRGGFPAEQYNGGGDSRSGRGVYFHVPYCDRICSFCNLNRTGMGNADLESYTEYLITEIEGWGKYSYIQNGVFDTVYFGGGTPTVLDTDQLSRIFRTLRRCFPLSEGCEITVESTQHNLPAEKAAALEAEGVNRFSIGVQTFSERGRKILGRTYNGNRVVEELAALRAAFTGVLGIDLIYSYPGQSIEEAAFDAETVIASGVDSVSFYSLMIHQGSSLAKSIEAGKISFERDIAFDRERHHLLYHALKTGGFFLLELSKMARPGRDRYRYIHTQYEGGDLVPIGSGAGGRIAGCPIYSMSPGRRFVSPSNAAYDAYYRILGLLQFGRYDPAVITENLGEEAAAAVREKLLAFEAAGYLEPDPAGSGYILNADGVFWGNNLAVEILKTAVRAEQKKEEIWARQRA
jgi:oxygen-independent coproporphyrinogen-3 oxidase